MGELNDVLKPALTSQRQNITVRKVCEVFVGMSSRFLVNIKQLSQARGWKIQCLFQGLYLCLRCLFFLSAFNASNCERHSPINFAVFNFISCCIVNLQPCRGMIGETKHERSSSFNGYDSW